MDDKPILELIEEYELQLSTIKKQIKQAKKDEDYHKQKTLKSIKQDLLYSIELMKNTRRN